MTWVIGSPSMWGYGLAISDIRVSFPDGSTADCLQKVYGVGRFIAAGFAGSVEFGFRALSDLSAELAQIPQGEGWIPGWVAFKWYRRVRRGFAAAPDSVRRLGSEIVLIGVSPTVDLGIPGFARPTVAILRAPNFEPQILRMNAIESIGSGRGVEPYREELERLGRDRQVQLSEAGMPGGFGGMLMHFLRGTLEEHPDRFVSPYVHLCLVRRGEISIQKSDYTIFEGGEPREIRMPPVATSWDEFQDRCQHLGADAGAAIC